jgi:hypothetical protein
VTGRWLRIAVFTVVVGLLAAGCESSSTKADDPIDPIALAAVPRRPLVPTRLPEGWTVIYRAHERPADHPIRSAEGVSQFLYLPPGGSGAAGPALLVGYIGDDQSAPVPCANDDPDEAAARERRQARRGLSVFEISGPDKVLPNAAYVIGRDVEDGTIDRALRTFRWEHPRQLEPGQGLRLRAASRLPASGAPGLAEEGVGTRGTGPGTQGVTIRQEDGNSAELAVARFWRSIEDVSTCANEPGQRTTFRGRTILRILASDPDSARLGAEVVEPSLRRVPLAEFEAG